jgi:hypothetical protein
MNTDTSEKYFKSLAADYVRAKGAELERERTDIEEETEHYDFARLDTKVRIAINREKSNRRKRFASWGAIAATFIFAVFATSLLRNYPFNRMDEMDNITAADAGGEVTSIPSVESEAGVSRIEDAYLGGIAEESTESDEMRSQLLALVSLTAPDGWQILYVDFDGDTAIYHLQSDYGNRVAVLANEPKDNTEYDDFMEIFINGQPAYMRVESTYSVLFFDMDGVRLTLSTEFEYEDLIALAEFWI